ncbi:DUF6998 domain-containing protein [Alteromonas mediterranea]|jgi:hypothetical protein|uniref:DUF6998 domain-containing protein n=1 Tax=Alteromonas mediterranea TaxID=314275 RepID=UPI0003557ACA|nr:hypothetical protein [Alteromonas mediterranea]AGP86555.1 hypothetical protein I607_13850 [Alteromonas mediterranea U4]AGP90717.1 hypothetical protein I876_14350 [Alteromonas mediterranea U7]AGP94548.1 hypothetical protein I634_14265 [Alteromonas mediterranea U8]
MKHIEQVPAKVREIYQIVSELEDMFGRHFTPDGHMVGSIGEVLAAYHYNLELLPASAERHDAVTKDGINVQIKATQARTIGLRSKPEHLIVLHLRKDGTNVEVFNGPGKLAWEQAGKLQKNGQRSIGVAKLSQIMETLSDKVKLPRKP